MIRRAKQWIPTDLARIVLDLLVDGLSGHHQHLGIGVNQNVLPVLLELSLVPVQLRIISQLAARAQKN